MAVNEAEALVVEDLGPFFDLTPDLLTVLDADGVIVAMNRAVTPLLGWRPEELVGTSWWELLHPDDVIGVKAEARRVLVTGEPSRTVELRLRRAVDGHRWFQASASPSPDAQRVYTIAVDMDARVEAARFREELLAGISHDMQTPLAAIVGLAEILLADGDPGSESWRLVDTIGRQARSLRRLVQQFLDYSRLEADRPLVLRPRPVDVTQVIDTVVGLFEHTRSFVVGADAGLPPVLVDPDRLEQVLANLVSNAVKFSEAAVRVVARRANEDTVMIDVVDEGPGIDGGEVDELFHKFHRGRNAGSQPGSGLGLYISRAVIEAQDGSLTVSSRPGFGSRFRVTLPTAHA